MMFMPSRIESTMENRMPPTTGLGIEYFSRMLTCFFTQTPK